MDFLIITALRGRNPNQAYAVDSELSYGKLSGGRIRSSSSNFPLRFFLLFVISLSALNKITCGLCFQPFGLHASALPIVFVKFLYNRKQATPSITGQARPFFYKRCS
ncbi:hypothetical protein [Paenibacillus sp. FSL P2-0136]|uniref:hypothetical protein n=1 Tax=unclassified Paenibacillus TaxID=185978 RepID=UPI0030DD1E84